MSWHKPLSKKYEVKKENKYKAKKEYRAGRWFDSKAEAALYDALMADLQAGLWVEVRCQVSVYLTDARILYKPDFLCIDPNGREIFAEMKGLETSSFRIKRRLWQYYGPSELQVWNFDHRRGQLILKETIKPKVKK